ncbi:glycoside hydrolase family 19 protein [Dyadobacter flavalbus]|uniref:Glycoside hydrolase family 19 protein n=1 Tax=Dyadobacter flavalbus TaxID=2579942 RepID=A0A5M8R3E3_9BACT|nr:glycoside hydrolase family 19 protein [Dyadobacter flavalbus]KAA6441456.1 glycoside hydrolase family 19 protein [Dyadobacter flavalbus]
MNTSKLHTLFPKSKAIIPYWDEVCNYAELITQKRIAMFLAQIGHESQGFTRLVENLNYSANGLAKTWPTRYAVNPNAIRKYPNKTALQIAWQPEKIANMTYANRYGNGDYESGDGWKYRGRGYMMTTFKDNYEALDFEFQMDGAIVTNPDMLLEPYWAIMSAAAFWKRNRLNRYADTSDVIGARKAVNGGLIGLADVNEKYSKILLA